MLKIFKKPLAIFLSLVIVFTVTIPILNAIVVLADEPIITTIIDFEDGENFKADSTSSGYSGVVTDYVTSGKKSYRRDIGKSTNYYYNTLTFGTKTSGTYFDLSEADILAIDFYIANIDVWNSFYDGKAHFVFRDSAEKSAGVLIPSGLSQGWNTLEFFINEISKIDLTKIGKIRFSPTTGSYTGNGPKLPDTTYQVSLRVDNIRKIKYPNDIFAPTCSTDKIEMLTVGGSFVTVEIGQFADDTTAKKAITYSVYTSSTPINADNIADCDLRVSNVTGSTVTIKELDANTSYYFAVVATDEAGNNGYLFNKDAVKTKASDENVISSILDFEEGEVFGYGPSKGTENTSGIYVGGHFGVVSTESTSGAKSFRRDWASRALYNNMFTFTPAVDMVYDLSNADVFAFDFYIDNISNWQKVYEGNAYIILKDSADNTAPVKLPYNLVQGWNTIEINLNSISGVALSSINAIRITPNTEKWSNNGPALAYPEGEESTVCNVSLRVDNLRKILKPVDVKAPTYDTDKINIVTLGGTFITAEIGQFSDNVTLKENIIYALYASKSPIDETNVEDCAFKTEELTGIVAALRNLDKDTDYYLAVKAIDEAGNINYLINKEAVTTKSSDSNIATNILSFEDSESFRYGPQGTENATGIYVSGHFAPVTTESTDGEKSFRRDWGSRALFNNMFTVSPAENRVFDLSNADVFAFDFYIDNISNWQKVYEGKAYVLLKDSAGTVRYVMLPYDMVEGWNSIEFNLHEIEGLLLDQIIGIRFTPNTTTWGTNAPALTYPEGEESTVCNVSLRVDNIRTIIEPTDTKAPSYNHKKITGASVSGTHITVEYPQFTDNRTIKENLIYNIYISESPINDSNIADCQDPVTVNNALIATIKDLKPATDYYFAVKCTDEVGNYKFLYSETPISTYEDASYICTPIFSCETSSLEDKGPQSRSYDTENKTEGEASLSGTLKSQAHYNNLFVTYRKNSPVDVSDCNVLSVDLYIGDIEVFNKFWRGHCYILLTDEEGKQTKKTSSSMSFEVTGDLVQGWNELQFSLKPEIDLSTIWAMRLSPHPDWQNDPKYNPKDDGATVTIAIDNVRAERLTLDKDKKNPAFYNSYMAATHITYNSVSIAHSLSYDNLTTPTHMVYEIAASKEKLTEENITTAKTIKATTTGRLGTVPNLAANTEYYFAVTAIDEAGNRSKPIFSETSYKTLNDIKDNWYMLTDCDAQSGVTLTPEAYVPRLPSYSTDPCVQGSTAALKNLDAGPLWHNQMTLEDLNYDIAYATRLNFKFYISSVEQYRKWWQGHLYLVIADAYGQAVGFAIPDDIHEGWNDITASLYGKAIDLANVTTMRVSTKPSMVSAGFTQEEQRIYDVSLTIALDYVTAEYDPSLLPTQAPTDKDAHYITTCDNIEEGGYWNTGVTVDEFEKTEGAASVYKNFGYGQKNANAFTYVAQEPINMYGAEALHFDMYISNVALLKNRTNIQVKLGSSNIATEKCKIFKLNLNTLQNGWNSITLELGDAFETSTEFDIANLTLFSLYCEKSIFLKGESVEIRLDNIRMTGDFTDAPLYEDEYEDEDVNIEYEEELITETIYETQILHTVENQKSDPINKMSTKTITHNLSYQLYVWLLAIGVPVLCVLGLVAFFVVARMLKKRRS